MVWRSEVLNLHKTRTWIIKFCRANALLPWLTERFQIRTPILLLRHPCAVVASKLNFPDWPLHRRFETPNTRYNEVYDEYRHILNNVSSEEEHLAAEWCMEYKLTLSRPKPHPWIVVTYEDLIVDGARELDRIYRALNLQTSGNGHSNLELASRTTLRANPLMKGAAQLHKWKKQLSRTQIDRILRIVRQFNLGFYTEDPMPDRQRLESDVH